MSTTPQFKSKVDWWLGLILVVAPVATVMGAVAADAGIVGWLGVILVALIYGGLVFPMRYVLEEDALVIRFGLVRSRIRYADIKAVTPTRNPLSSPALSLDRLHIDAGSHLSGMGLGPNISPADKAGFLRALAERTPRLRHEGDRLVPAAE